jgi:hypothetical protein
LPVWGIIRTLTGCFAILPICRIPARLVPIYDSQDVSRAIVRKTLTVWIIGVARKTE